MIDNFSLLLSHGLILLTLWRLASRADLDSDDAPSPAAPDKQVRGARPFLKGRGRA